MSSLLLAMSVTWSIQKRFCIILQVTMSLVRLPARNFTTLPHDGIDRKISTGHLCIRNLGVCFFLFWSGTFSLMRSTLRLQPVSRKHISSFLDPEPKISFSDLKFQDNYSRSAVTCTCCLSLCVAPFGAKKHHVKDTNILFCGYSLSDGEISNI